MHFYFTPRGRWATSRDDIRPLAAADGGCREIYVPTDKAGLLAFLNEFSVGAVNLPAAAPQDPPAAPSPSRGARWRVYVKGLFACVVRASSAEDARAAAVAALEVRETLAC